MQDAALAGEDACRHSPTDEDLLLLDGIALRQSLLHAAFKLCIGDRYRIHLELLLRDILAHIVRDALHGDGEHLLRQPIRCQECLEVPQEGSESRTLARPRLRSLCIDRVELDFVRRSLQNLCERLAEIVLVLLEIIILIHLIHHGDEEEHFSHIGAETFQILPLRF